MTLQTPVEIEYPETDGQPMGETDIHIDWMIRLRDMLKHRYRGQQVYVTGNLLMYYEEGVPLRFVVPDCMVVKDCDPGRRRIYKLWEEKRTPCTVIETTSKSSKREDLSRKATLYEELGIREYFLYDPTADYLRPPMQGHRLVGEKYAPITPDAGGRLLSEELGLWLSLEDGDLVMFDAQTGERVLTEAEAAQAAEESAQAAYEAAQAEIERLRKKLSEHGLSE